MAITNKEMQLLQRIIEIEVSKRVEQQLLLLESRLGKKPINEGYDEIPRLQKAVSQRRRNTSLASLEEDVKLSQPARKSAQPLKNNSILGSILAETQITDEFMEEEDEDGNLLFEDVSEVEQQAINRQPRPVQQTLSVLQNMDFTKKLAEIYEKSSYTTPEAVEIRI